MRHPASRWSAAAACAAILLVWLLVPGQQSTASAFHAYAKAIVSAQSARFDAEVTIEGQPKQVFHGTYLAPGKYRQEFPNLVNVVDFGAKTILNLIPLQKKATIMRLEGDHLRDASGDWFDRMRELLAKPADQPDAQFERLGHREIGGIVTEGFRYDTAAGSLTMWGDPQTGQPVQIEQVFSGIPRSEVVLTNFVLNVELDPAQFSITPPAEYSVQSFDVDTSPPTEADLTAGLRTAAELNGGQFLDKLDTASMQQAIISSVLKTGQPPSDEQMAVLMKQALTVGRGLSFVLNRRPEEIEAFYAGQGVKLGTVGVPLLWYRLSGATHYRVIFADLATGDAATPPEVPGAQRIEKTNSAPLGPQP